MSSTSRGQHWLGYWPGHDDDGRQAGKSCVLCYIVLMVFTLFIQTTKMGQTGNNWHHGRTGRGRKEGWMEGWLPVCKGLKMCGGSEHKPWGINDIRWAILSYSIIYLTV